MKLLAILFVLYAMLIAQERDKCFSDFREGKISKQELMECIGVKGTSGVSYEYDSSLSRANREVMKSVSNTSATPSKQAVEHKKEIVLISSPSCPYCKKAKRLLTQEGVPLIIFGDRVLRGFSEQSILQALRDW